MPKTVALSGTPFEQERIQKVSSAPHFSEVPF
jgi:hypothetical protein